MGATQAGPFPGGLLINPGVGFFTNLALLLGCHTYIYDAYPGCGGIL